MSKRIPGIIPVKRRTPHLASYMQPIKDGSAGVFRDLMTNVDATITGGSTHAQDIIKWYDNYQRLTGLAGLPEIRGFRASAATVNLDYGLANGPQSVSAEVDDTAGDHTASNGTISVISTDSWHGARCFQLLATGAAPALNTDLTSVTAAGQQDTTSAMVKAPAGRTIRISLIGNSSGATNGDFTATGQWQRVQITSFHG